MTIHITQIGKHRFACGLFWQSLSRPRELMKEAAELAKRINFDLVVLRKDHATAQAGFALTGEGVRRTTYSLGAAVSKTVAMEGADYDGQQQPAHNWLGAFKLPDDKWAYFAVRDANFLPNGDFAGTKEQVMDRLYSDYAMGGWNVVIGDPELEEYGFHNFTKKKIEELIPHSSNGQIKAYNWWALRPVNSGFSWNPATMALACAAVFAVVGIPGFKYYQHYQLEKQREAAFELARQRMAAATVAPVAHPWSTMPSPRTLVNACYDKFGYLTPGGWQLDDFLCNPSGVRYSWSRQDSTVSFLLAEVPKAEVEMSGNKANLAEQMHFSSGTDDALMDQKHLFDPIVSRLQLMDLSMKLTPVAAPLPPAPKQPGGQIPASIKPAWQTFSFILNAGGLPPREIASILSAPGVRLSKLSYHNGDWSYEGVMYAKLP